MAMVDPWMEDDGEPWAENGEDPWAEGDADLWWARNETDSWADGAGEIEPDRDVVVQAEQPASGCDDRRRTAGKDAAADSAGIVALSERIRRAVECPVCLLLLRDVACLCPNGHALCGDCSRQIWTSGIERNCPLCRAALAPSPNARVTAAKVTELLAALTVSCAHRSHGCLKLVAVRDVAGHEAECPHAPEVPCLAAVCQWIGAYDKLFHHVCYEHNDVAYVAARCCLVVRNLQTTVTRNRRRTYLAHSPHGLLWVVLTWMTRGRVRVGVFVVERPQRAQQQYVAPPDVVYRVAMRYSSGQIKGYSRPRLVGRSSSLAGNDHGGSDAANDAHTVILNNRGRIDILWWLEAARQDHSWRSVRRISEC